MEDLQNIFTNLVLPHWPFAAWLVTAMIIGQIMKTSVWTKEHAGEAGRWQKVSLWGYRTLPAHPVLAGLVLGAIWREPEEGMTKLPASMAYFALAGACSVFSFEILKAFAKSKGVDLTLPGQSKVPSTPPPPLTPAVPSTNPPPAPEATTDVEEKKETEPVA